mmetsp:Transcript_73721/g.163847  ORF Transcript_73721/g.163847 Transcript_73721/m.163847 type:complete len:165 (-) Transcript_73721:709-1203(-)
MATLLFPVLSTLGSGVLELKGSSPAIEMNGASLHLSCMNQNASVLYATVPENSTNAVVALMHIGACDGTSAVCISSMMKPFTCNYIGSSGTVSQGPLAGTFEESRASMGELLAVMPIVECPMGDLTTKQLETLGSSVRVTVSFKGETLPLVGATGDDVVKLTKA